METTTDISSKRRPHMESEPPMTDMAEQGNLTEQEKMAQGLWYDPGDDKELRRQRRIAEELCYRLNQTSPTLREEREEILDALLPDRGEKTKVLSPFYTDYGINCHIGAGTFINHNAYLMDGGRITIGANCFIGPNCGFYTACHPILADERNLGIERALPIEIGDNVWLGGSVTVLPGVKIGEGSVIGAGSVVTKDIPAGVIAAGNPCRVMREIGEADRIGAGTGANEA